LWWKWEVLSKLQTPRLKNITLELDSLKEAKHELLGHTFPAHTSTLRFLLHNFLNISECPPNFWVITWSF
jgi:hypothetical protein